MSDPLAQYRKRPASAPQAATGEPEGYVAFAARDRAERLRIRRANDPTRSPGYRDLWDIIYDGPFGTNFVLVYAFMMVAVRGRNLQHLIVALETGMADFIQEFDPERWAKPSDPNAPFIESIEITIPESAPSLPEMDKHLGGGSSTSKPH